MVVAVVYKFFVGGDIFVVVCFAFENPPPGCVAAAPIAAVFLLFATFGAPPSTDTGDDDDNAAGAQSSSSKVALGRFFVFVCVVVERVGASSVLFVLGLVAVLFVFVVL